MATLSISPSDILAHRSRRKQAGLVGCKDGSDMPLSSLSGMSWRPADPMNPSCFCFDCRDTWDADGLIDLHLLQNGHERAVDTYASLFSHKTKAPVSPPVADVGLSNLAPTTTEVGFSNEIQVPAVPLSLSLPIPAPNHEPAILQSISQLIREVQAEQIRAMDLKRLSVMTEDAQQKERIVEASLQYEMYCEETVAHLQAMSKQFRSHMATWE